MSIEVELSQDQFLAQGGVYMRALAEKKKSGEHAKSFVFHEYPKDIRLNERDEDYEDVAETIKGATITKHMTRRVWDTVTVHSEEEEDRVRAGGGSAADAEDERLELMQKCRNLHIRVDPTWTVVRLRRELGMEMDKPVRAKSADEEFDDLEAQMERLLKKKEMRAKIAALEAEAIEPVKAAKPARAAREPVVAETDEFAA